MIYTTEEFDVIDNELTIFCDAVKLVDQNLEKDYSFIIGLSENKKSVTVKFVKKLEKRQQLLGRFAFLLSKVSDDYYAQNYSKNKLVDMKKSLCTLIVSKIKKWR